MKATFFALAASSVASALALPWGGSGCLSQSDANTLVARYADVIAQRPSDIGSPTATAEFIAAVGYFEESDSANINIGLPVSHALATLIGKN